MSKRKSSFKETANSASDTTITTATLNGERSKEN